MNNEIIVDNLYDLYASYHHHKLLFDYYMDHKNIKGEKEIKERINYIKKHKIKQRNEVETLLWILGEIDDENAND